MRKGRLAGIFLAACLPTLAIGSTYGAIIAGWGDQKLNDSVALSPNSINIGYVDAIAEIPLFSIKSVTVSTSSDISYGLFSVKANMEMEPGCLETISSIRVQTTGRQFSKIRFSINGNFGSLAQYCSGAASFDGAKYTHTPISRSSGESSISCEYYILDKFSNFDVLYCNNSLQGMIYNDLEGNNTFSGFQFYCEFDFSVPPGTNISSLNVSNFTAELVL